MRYVFPSIVENSVTFGPGSSFQSLVTAEPDSGISIAIPNAFDLGFEPHTFDPVLPSCHRRQRQKSAPIPLGIDDWCVNLVVGLHCLKNLPRRREQ